MSRRLKQAAVALIIIFGAAQLVRPDQVNPTTDEGHTIRNQLGPKSEFVAILDRACSDCHSNETRWPWYTQIAPLSWLMAQGVSEGRKAVNFSEWTSYPPDRQRALLSESCQDVSDGRMPGSPYTMLHPEARLSSQDIQTVCQAAR